MATTIILKNTSGATSIVLNSIGGITIAPSGTFTCVPDYITEIDLVQRFSASPEMSDLVTVGTLVFNFNGTDLGAAQTALAMDLASKLDSALYSGSVSFSDSNMETVVFPSAVPNTQYIVTYSVGDENVTMWWENKTVNGFDLVSNIEFTGTVDWSVTY